MTESKRVALMIREMTSEGRDLVEAMLEIADVGPNKRPDLRTNTPGEKRIRSEMLRFLFERVFGRTPQEFAVQFGIADPQRSFAPLSEDTLVELAGVRLLENLPAPSDGIIDAESHDADAELVEDEDDDDDDEHLDQGDE